MRTKLLTPTEIILLVFIFLCVVEMIFGTSETSYCELDTVGVTQQETTYKEETTTFVEETTTEEPTTVEEPTTEEETEPEEFTEVIPEQEEELIFYYYTQKDVLDLAKLLYIECGAVESTTEKACVAWVVLNRADNKNMSVYDVMSSAGQFDFREWIDPPDEIISVAADVLERWNLEKNGYTDVGRVLPRDYEYFYGDGYHNYFRNAYNGDYDTWDYSLESPYID